MIDTRILPTALLFLASVLVAPAALAAAAPDDGDLTEPQATFAAGPRDDPSLDTEMVVSDWVLCVSQAFAERLVTALDQGIDQAVAAYGELKADRSCGQFGELRVILHEAVFRSASERQATVFSADVGFAGAWAPGFVVQGALPSM